MIKIDDIEKIIEVVNKYNFSRFEFEQDKSKIIIEKSESLKTENNESLKFETKSFESKIEKVQDFKEEHKNRKFEII